MPDPLPPDVPPVDYIERWRQMVERRRIQMESEYAANGVVNSDYWGKRAKNYRQALHARTDEDPFLMRVRDAVTKNATVLDVGAGTGRHTLALAPHVAHVTAVDPSEAMLGFLREDVHRQSLANVGVVQAEWMNASVPRADMVICSHVLYPIAEPLPFIRRLEEHARDRVFIYLRVDPLPTDMGLWSEFYGIPLQTQPSALDLLNLLAQAGIIASMEIVNHHFTWTFETLDEAVAQVRNTLCLNEADDASTAKVRDLLEQRLIRRDDGRHGPDVGSTRSAIISWSSGSS